MQIYTGIAFRMGIDAREELLKQSEKHTRGVAESDAENEVEEKRFSSSPWVARCLLLTAWRFQLQHPQRCR